MSAERDFTSIEETAAGWIVERDQGLSREREREFERWLQADARHARAFSALAETWQLIGETRPAMLALPEPVNGGSGRRQTWGQLALAAAAIAIAALGWWRLDHVGQMDTATPFAVASATEVGMLRKIPLPDGSVIQLNTDTALEIRYTETERRVTLARGEAHFTVAKNSERPFIVSVAGVDVRVVGTVFNVRLRADAVDVLVTQGKVRVDGPVAATEATTSADETTHSELTAGQKLSLGLQAEAKPVAKRAELSVVEIKQALAWQARRLDFDAAPLDEIVTEMNRYNRHKLVIADSRLTERRFGGSFPAGDYETIVRMLEANFGITGERKGGETWLRMKTVEDGGRLGR